MVNTGFLYAEDNKRIFINSCLGCKGGCKYCYLSKMNTINNKQIKAVIGAEEIINQLSESGLDNYIRMFFRVLG